MPNKVPFTNAIIDLCLPFKLNVAVIGKNKSGKSSYIESIVKLLTEKTALHLIENQLMDKQYFVQQEVNTVSNETNANTKGGMSNRSDGVPISGLGSNSPNN
jgi:ABC-type Mn2+/Zn2+ transport system ATPase subunit